MHIEKSHNKTANTQFQVMINRLSFVRSFVRWFCASLHSLYMNNCQLNDFFHLLFMRMHILMEKWFSIGTHYTFLPHKMKRIFEHNLSSLILCYIQHIQGGFFSLSSCCLLLATINYGTWQSAAWYPDSICLSFSLSLSLYLSVPMSWNYSGSEDFRCHPARFCFAQMYIWAWQRRTCHKFRIHGKYENSCSFISLSFPAK